MIGLIILAVCYMLVSFFYLIFAVIIAARGKKEDRRLKKFFPVQCSYGLDSRLNAICLAEIAIATFVIMMGLFRFNTWAIVAAILLSALEVLLSFIFYLKEDSVIDTVGHLIIHAVIIIYLAEVLARVYWM